MIQETPTQFRIHVERHRLSSGLELLLVPRRELPIVSLTLLVRDGIAAELPGEGGLAHLTAVTFPQGTRTRSALQLSEAVESLGTSLGVHADYDHLSLGLSTLARDFDAALSLLAEVALQPAFALEEVERKRRDVLSHLERRKDDLTDRVRNRLAETLYGEHPYRNPRLGSTETVSVLAPESVFAFYERVFVASRCVLAIVGDIEPARLIDRIETAFGPWPQRAAPAPLPPPPSPRTIRGIETIEKRGVVQATIRAGSLSIARNDPDYAALQLVNYILGGSGLGSRLMRNLREERGLTYGVYSGFSARREAGHFSIGLQTSLESAELALREVLREVDRLLEDGVTDNELRWAERFFTGSLPLSFQTNDQLATYLLEQELFDLEDEFWMRDLERMKALSRADLDAAARRHIHPDQSAVVVLGDFDETTPAPRLV